MQKVKSLLFYSVQVYNKDWPWGRLWCSLVATLILPHSSSLICPLMSHQSQLDVNVILCWKATPHHVSLLPTVLHMRPWVLPLPALLILFTSLWGSDLIQIWSTYEVLTSPDMVIWHSLIGSSHNSAVPHCLNSYHGGLWPPPLPHPCLADITVINWAL